MARSVHEIERIDLPVLCLVLHADRMGFDRDAAFAFKIHGIQDLLLLVAVGNRIGLLQQTIRQGGFPMVDVGDDTEIADMGYGHGQLFIIWQAGDRVNHDGKL